MANESQDITAVGAGPQAAVRFTHLSLPCKFDGAEQLVRYWQAPGQNRPALVFLHSWSTDYLMNPGDWLTQAVNRGWSIIMPNFRGPNDKPIACGSPAARADVLDAADFALDVLKCDPTRLYLAGGSGGAHMTLLMCGHAPTRFTAASAWCGLASIADFYFHHKPDGKPTRYAQMVEQCIGGVPGDPAVEPQLIDRSPMYHLQHARDMPIDIAHGVHDGKPLGRGVASKQSIDCFNVLAKAHAVDPVSDRQTRELWDADRLSQPRPGDTDPDPEFEGRAVILRRHAGPSRLTIFEGGHDGLAYAGCQFLSRHARPVSRA